MRRQSVFLLGGLALPAGLAYGAYLYFLNQSHRALLQAETMMAEAAQINSDTAFAVFSLLLAALACTVCWMWRGMLWHGLALFSGLSVGLLSLCGVADALFNPYSTPGVSASSMLNLLGGGLFWYLLAALCVHCVNRRRAQESSAEPE